MRSNTLSRRSILQGLAISASALSAPGLLPRPAAAQPAPAAPVTLRAAENADMMSLSGPGRLALFNDALPGPVLRATQGDTLAVQLDNALRERFALVFHGVRLPSEVHGNGDAASVAVAPGARRTVSFATRDAGTYWYHASDPGLARRALAGALIVAEPGPPAYGADHVVFIQSFPPESGVPLFPVNGAISPTFEGPGGGRARLRFINATGFLLRLQVVGPPIYALAVDGHPVAPFDFKDGFVNIAAGGRVDVAATLDTANASVIQIVTAKDPIQIAIVAPVGSADTPADGPPEPLPGADLPQQIPLTGAARFNVPIGAGGLPANAPEPAAATFLGKIASGQAMVLTLANSLAAPVSVHIDGNPVRLLDAGDDGWRPWWHDTVPVPPQTTVRVALVGQNPGKWAILAQRNGDGLVVASLTYQVGG